jgi:hypothetical protein
MNIEELKKQCQEFNQKMLDIGKLDFTEFQYFDVINLTNKLFIWNTTQDVLYDKWIFNLYKKIIKSRPILSDIGKYPNLLTHSEYNKQLEVFIEDLVKLPEAFDKYHRLKKRKLIDEKDRDINKFTSINDFCEFVLNQQISNLDYKGLTESQLECIINYKGVKTPLIGQAEVLYEDSVYYVIKLIDYKASQAFAFDTIWCTRFPDAFKSYMDNDGLYVIIKKTYGSKTSSIGDKLQFNPGTMQFMNTRDRPYDYDTFLSKRKKNVDIFEAIIKDCKKLKIDNFESNFLHYVRDLDINLNGNECINDVIFFKHFFNQKRKNIVRDNYKSVLFKGKKASGFSKKDKQISIDEFNLNKVELLDLENFYISSMSINSNIEKIYLNNCTIENFTLGYNKPKLRFLVIQNSNVNISLKDFDLSEVEKIEIINSKGIKFEGIENINPKINSLVINGCKVPKNIAETLHQIVRDSKSYITLLN